MTLLQALAKRKQLYAEGDKLYAEACKLWAEARKLYDEGDKLWDEGDKLMENFNGNFHYLDFVELYHYEGKDYITGVFLKV